jgi:hypothetical protein
MRCPDCNKFVSYDDTTEPEHNLEINDNGDGSMQVTGDVKIVLTCAECGTELKEYTFEVDETVGFDFDKTGHTCHIPEVIGCQPHVAGTPCTVCGWNGEVQVPAWKKVVTRYDPPQTEVLDVTLSVGGDERIVFQTYGEIREGNATSTYRDKDAFEEAAAKAEVYNRGKMPAERKHVPAHEESEYSIEVDDVQLTSRADCGVNKKTGKPNKFNARYATTYYGVDLDGTVKCTCGEVEAEFHMHDEVAASGMDELV